MRLALLILVPLIALSGCFPEILAIEVLPPRLGGDCGSPLLNEPSAGRGLLDLDATVDFHGAFVADLRISARTDLVVDGVALRFDLPNGASGESESESEKVDGEQPLGDLLLTGEDDDVRSAIVENVVLLPRRLAKALRDDDDLDITRTEYATVTIEVFATKDGRTIGEIPSTFAVDVCEGCLVEMPGEDVCEDGVQMNSVCRVGQDEVVYGCAPAPQSILPFP